MTYLIVQTFMLLLVAGLFGLILGWYLTRNSAASAHAKLQTRFRNAEREALKLRGELNAMTTAKANCDTERRLLSDELADLRARQDAALAAGTVETGDPGDDAAAPPLLSNTDGDADDLRQIKGIGPKIAGILTELGIRRFEQIAAWNPGDVDWVNAQLKFKGRVEREQWILQARALMADRDS